VKEPAVAEQTVICTYRVKRGNEAAFLDLLERHWPTLHELGFVTDEPARVLRQLGSTEPTLLEIFTWRDGGFQRAHEHPRVLAIWEPMEPLCEARDGAASMDFPHYEPIELPSR
jgi:hypothetical protein